MSGQSSQHCNDLHETESKDEWLSVYVKQIRTLDTQYCTKAPPIPDKKSLNETDQTRPRHLVFLVAHSTLTYNL